MAMSRAVSVEYEVGDPNGGLQGHCISRHRSCAAVVTRMSSCRESAHVPLVGLVTEPGNSGTGLEALRN